MPEEGIHCVLFTSLLQVLDAADGVPGPPRLRRSRCVTKYKFRTAAEAAAAGGGPQIIGSLPQEYNFHRHLCPRRGCFDSTFPYTFSQHD